MLEPMKPAPPVTTIMRGVIALVLSAGAAGAPVVIFSMVRVVEKTVLEIGQLHLAAPAFHQIAAHHAFAPIVRTLDQHVWPQTFDQRQRRRIVENWSRDPRWPGRR